MDPVDAGCPGIWVLDAERLSPPPGPGVSHPVSSRRWGEEEHLTFRKDPEIWLRKPRRAGISQTEVGQGGGKKEIKSSFVLL